MNDTSAEIEKMIRVRYASMSAIERMQIASQMLESARALVRASLPPGLSELQQRRALCERFYGSLADAVFAATPREFPR